MKHYSSVVKVDVVIFGGGCAGLWLLDELRRSGFGALLVEKVALGSGQTVVSQGIIHGGLKYAVTGSQRASAGAIKDMPELWRARLRGDGDPDLSGVAVRSDCCHMWRTTSLRGTLGMIGARAGLRSSAEKVAGGDRPSALAGCRGDVYRIDEQVIDTGSFVRVLGDMNRDRIIRCEDVEFRTSAPGVVSEIRLTHPDSGAALSLQPDHVVLAAGAGNAALRDRAGLSGEAMQRRPLHMVMVRGDLPQLFGHCIDGAGTRVTITSARTAGGETVWQVGGKVSEDGVALGAGELMVRARDELREVLPGVDFAGARWLTYLVDRAEGRTPDFARPTGSVVRCEGNVITAWPTKLVLAPRVAAEVCDYLGDAPAGADAPALRSDWPRPDVAPPPWETDRPWVTLD